MTDTPLARLRALVAALPPGGSLRGPSRLGRCPVLLRADLAAVLELCSTMVTEAAHRLDEHWHLEMARGEREHDARVDDALTALFEALGLEDDDE